MNARLQVLSDRGAGHVLLIVPELNGGVGTCLLKVSRHGLFHENLGRGGWQTPEFGWMSEIFTQGNSSGVVLVPDLVQHLVLTNNYIFKIEYQGVELTEVLQWKGVPAYNPSLVLSNPENIVVHENKPISNSSIEAILAGIPSAPPPSEADPTVSVNVITQPKPLGDYLKNKCVNPKCGEEIFGSMSSCPWCGSRQ